MMEIILKSILFVGRGFDWETLKTNKSWKVATFNPDHWEKVAFIKSLSSWVASECSPRARFPFSRFTFIGQVNIKQE